MIFLYSWQAVFQGKGSIRISHVVERKLRHSEVACRRAHSWVVEGARVHLSE